MNYWKTLFGINDSIVVSESNGSTYKGADKKASLSVPRGNSKLGDTLNISLPPGVTCRRAAPCYNEGCYGRKFYRMRGTVQRAWDNNLRLLNANRERYFDIIAAHITIANPRLFRWHVSGDIVDLDYLRRMISLAHAKPDTKFLAFTKQYEIVEDAMANHWHFPPNLRLVISAWPGLDIPSGLRDIFPVAWMIDKKNPDPRFPHDAKRCNGGCNSCGLCWQMNAGESTYFDKH